MPPQFPEISQNPLILRKLLLEAHSLMFILICLYSGTLAADLMREQ